MWDTSSLNAMEKTATGEEDACCAKKLKNGLWLEVKVIGQRFEYRYDQGIVTREAALIAFRQSF